MRGSQENGYYPITDVITHGTKDQDVTYLFISDPEQNGKQELITTTGEHPFYVTEFVNKIPRPKSEGHEDLNNSTPRLERPSWQSQSGLRGWIGAGHLLVGDKIKQADGTYIIKSFQYLLNDS